MSLIADALRKAETTSPASPPPPSPGSLWVYRALLLGCVVVVLASLGLVAKRRARTTAVPAATAAAQAAAKREPSGLQLLRTAQRDMRLNGIVVGGPGKPLALINDRVVQEGDHIQGARLVRIDPDTVQLEENGRIRTLKLED